MYKYREYFGFTNEPFSNEIETKYLLPLPSTLSIKERMAYVVHIGGIMVVTGDVGSGKSSSLRFALSQFHKSEILSLYVVASTGSINELYKQLAWALELNLKTSSKTLLLKEIKSTIQEIVTTQKKKIILLIDEANLLRSDIFGELHTLTQFAYDSINLFSMILAGRPELIDKLSYRPSMPLSSRVVTRSHMAALNLEQMSEYLLHHLRISGVKKNIFSPESITAIHQGSGGLLRKANALAKGALIACMIEQSQIIEADHVRLASTELI